MSAWIVSKNHIDCLVSGAIRLGLVDSVKATKVGRMLWEENYKSVNWRYNESNKAPKYSFVEYDSTNGYLCRQIHCYAYQSCNHTAWEKSAAKKLCDSMLALFPNVEESLDYKASPWGVPEKRESPPTNMRSAT